MATRSLISRLDPQAQSSITGGKVTTSSGTTYKPASKDLVSGRDALLAKTITNLKQAGADVTQSTNKAAASVAAGGGGMLAVQPTPVVTQPGTTSVGSGSIPSSTPSTTSTGTGGTPQTSTTPQTPAGPAAAGAGSAGAASALAGFTEDEISAALAGLEAQYGMTRAQLLADQTQAGAQYRLLLAQLERGRVQGIETATNDAVRRGIYRSGILGENIADVEAATLSGRSQAEAELQAREQATQEQLRGLDASQQAQAAQIEAQLRRQYAETLLAAGVAPGAGMAAQPAMAPIAASGIPQVNTQGLQGAPAPNVLTTPVAQTQTPQATVVTPPPPAITTNPSPAYRDPREAEWAYQQYMQMLAQQGYQRTVQPVNGLPAGVRSY